MSKTTSSKTQKLREAERKKKEKESANRLEYYYANRESINRKRREKTAQAREMKAASSQKVTDTSTVLDESAKTKKYDWALYKRRQRARAKEEAKKEEKSKKATRKCRRNEDDDVPAFPLRMSKKRRVDLVKSHLPETPAKKLDVLTAIIESPTTRKGLENKGIIPGAKNDEAEVAVAAMHEARDAISATKGQRSDDSRAATQTALGFLFVERK